MADTNETIADIISEMRRGTRLPGYWHSCDVNKILQYHADRLEAAHKRELSKNVSKNGADFGQLGDAAKLRDALNRLVIASEGFLKTHSAKYYVDTTEALDKAKSALAEPVRNCDVGTAQEQAERWYWRYHVGHLCQSCPLGPRKWSEVDAGTLCFSEWQQMPYEEGGAK